MNNILVVISSITRLAAASLVLILITSVNAQLQPDTPLSPADASFIGEAAGDESGWVESAGDVNNDGFDDIFIAAWKNDEAGSDAGQTYLFLGSDTIDWSMDMSVSQADASFIGEAAGDRSGTRASTAGDVNGDGFYDFIISAYFNDANGTDAGKSYLFLGSDTLILSMDMSLSQANASFIGETAEDYAIAAGPTGDFNGDGLDDLLFAGNQNDEGGIDAGQIYLVLGRAEADWGVNFDLSLADASFIGETGGDRVGYTGAESAGDVNGDGFDDIIIGAPYNNQITGKAYLILGRQAADWGMDCNLSSADASFIGEAVDDGAGIDVASARDVNGDGLDDILIGSDWNSDGGTKAGQTYLILGKTGADWGQDFQLSEADASFIGETPEGKAGRIVNSAGDVNGDGLDDILIGARDYENLRGKAYLILGNSAADWGMDFNISSADASFIGEAAGDWAGWPAASAGDVNGDGLNDILIGAGLNDEGGSNAGQSYLILGNSLVVTGIAGRNDILPTKFALHSAYPNPFNPVSTIRYDLPQGSEISLIVYNILGREVARLVDSYMEPGYHQAQWNGRNSSSRELPSGIYIARLITPEYTNSIKMLLLK